MTSILKVDNIKDSADNQAISISNGVVTFANDVIPTDNVSDLGTSSSRYKDLFLSGGAYLGGTGSANYLDDYEEGTFTPSVTFCGGSTGVTYSSSRRIGKYTKIGNCVEYFVHVELTNKGSSTGAVQITGLPFTVVGDQHYIPGAVFISAMASLASGAPVYRALNGTTALDCYQIVNSTYGTITNSNYTNTTGVQVSGKYYV